ncbi:hypothetical protein BDK51DRAFT_37665, partial [Blyttiomyces helicus]
IEEGGSPPSFLPAESFKHLVGVAFVVIVAAVAKFVTREIVRGSTAGSLAFLAIVLVSLRWIYVQTSSAGCLIVTRNAVEIKIFYGFFFLVAYGLWIKSGEAALQVNQNRMAALKAAAAEKEPASGRIRI